MSQRFSHATIQRQILGFFCIWHMAIQKHMSAQWTMMSLMVLAVRCFEYLGLSELWVGFGTGQHYRDIPIHTIRSNIGPLKSLALSLFHSLTGCDTTSQLFGCGKKTAWAAWSSMPELTDTLLALTYKPDLFCLILSYSCTARGVVQIVAMKQCIVSSPLEADHWKIYHLPKLHCSSM